MSEKIKRFFLLVMPIILSISFGFESKACYEKRDFIRNEEEWGQPFKVIATAYYQGSITATGVAPRQGIVATTRKWLGYTMAVYRVKDDGSCGDFIGYFECLDTGFGSDFDGDGIGTIQEGKAVDFYFCNLEECRDWMKFTKGNVYIQLFWAEG